MLVVGLAGAGVNVAAAWALSRAERRSLNVEGARAHVLADLYASLGAALAGLLVLTAGLERADVVVALLVAALMVRSGFSLLGQSTRVLLEAAPRGIDPDAVGHALAAHPGVSEVHDLHVWEVTSGFPALSAHVLVPAGEDCHARRAELERLLAERFGLEHTTLQVEHEADERPARHHAGVARRGASPPVRTARPALAQDPHVLPRRRARQPCTVTRYSPGARRAEEAQEAAVGQRPTRRRRTRR